MRWTGFGLMVVALSTGCHPRYKKYVSSIEDVRPQVLVTTGPSVNLGGASGDSVLAAAVNVVQGIRSIDAANRLAGAVDIHGVDKAFKAGLRKALGDGPPFGTTDDPKGSLLQVEVVDYGLESPMMGVAGVFNYDLHVEIYLANGKKVYNGHQECKIGFGDASALSQVLGTVDNVKQLDQMSDAEIQQTFENAAVLCGQDLVMKLRKQGSSNHLSADVAGLRIDEDPAGVELALD
jgi:hypothetical protein